MKRIQFNKGFYVAIVLAMICSIALLLICWQEDIVEEACIAISEGRDDEAVELIDDLWSLNTVNSNKETVLMAACKAGNSTIIYHLIELRADLNYSPPGKMSPVELFCRYGYKQGYEPIISLLQSGAKQSRYELQPGLYHLAEQFYWMEKGEKKIATELAIVLLQYGAPMGYNDSTILHYAAKGNMSDLFYTVVHTTEGLHLLTIKDNEGKTPWDVAVSSGAVAVQRVIRNLEEEYREESGEGTSDPLAPIGPTIPVEDLPVVDPEDVFD